MTEGIEFSVAVALTADSGGRLSAEVPAEVSERLGISAGDVLCWTGFFGGTVEVWSVPKSPDASPGGEDGENGEDGART